MALPRPKAFWPIVVPSGSTLAVFHGAGVAASPAISIAAGTYYSPDDLLAALNASLTAHNLSTGRQLAATISAEGRFTISDIGNPFGLGFDPGFGVPGWSPIHNVLGFPDAHRAVAGTHVAPYQHQNGWYAADPVVDDTGDLPDFQRSQVVSLGGIVKSLDFGVRRTRLIQLAFLPAWKLLKSEEGAHVNEAIERLFESGWTRFRWWPDVATPSSWADYVLDADTAKALPRNRLGPAAPFYSLALKLRPFIA